MKKKPTKAALSKPILPQQCWAIVSPWNRRPFVYRGLRFTRHELVAQLNESRGMRLTLDGWQRLGWRFIRVEVKPL